MPTPTPKPPAPASSRPASPFRMATLGVYRDSTGTYMAEATYVNEPCGCKVVGAGLLPAPFRVKFCAGHSAYPALLAERDALRALLLELSAIDFEECSVHGEELNAKIRRVLAETAGNPS